MFIIWGTRNKIVTTDPTGDRAVCPRCRVESQFIERQVVNYFTLYLIPLFPIKRGVKFVECLYCHAQLANVTIADLRAQNDEAERQRSDQAAAQQAATAQRRDEIAARHASFEAHPEDRTSLVRLLDLLAEEGRYAELMQLEPRVRAHYGEDPDLLIRLAHAAFALKRFPEAIRDYELILASNQYRGDARFYLASSYWSQDPPDWERALQHMQIASDMGYRPAVEALPRLKRARSEAPMGGRTSPPNA